jgi:hypothetical protein
MPEPLSTTRACTSSSSHMVVLEVDVGRVLEAEVFE